MILHTKGAGNLQPQKLLKNCDIQRKDTIYKITFLIFYPNAKIDFAS